VAEAKRAKYGPPFLWSRRVVTDVKVPSAVALNLVAEPLQGLRTNIGGVPKEVATTYL
jgi:hypothetical protein